MIKRKTTNKIMSILLSITMILGFVLTDAGAVYGITSEAASVADDNTVSTEGETSLGSDSVVILQADENTLSEKIEYNGEPVYRGVSGVIQSREDPNESPYLTFYYSDGYFKESPTIYNEHLATLSALLAVASKLTNQTDTCVNMLKSMGCSNIEKNNEYGQGGKHTISYVVAKKTLFEGTKDECTLIPIAVRGFFYNYEWCDNFTIGLTGDSAGISNQANKIKNHIATYISENNIDPTKVKFLLTGYSRGGGVSNVAGKVLSDIYGKENVYGYATDAQMCADTSASTSPSSYTNLHVLANYNDFVTMVAPTYLGFSHYGTVHTFGQDKGRAAAFANEEAAMLTKLKFINEGTWSRYNSPTNFTWAKVQLNEDTISSLIKGETNIFTDIDTEHKQGNSIRDCMDLTYTRLKESGVAKTRADYSTNIPSDVSSAANKIGATRNYTIEDVVCECFGLMIDLTPTQSEQLSTNFQNYAKSVSNWNVILYTLSYLKTNDVPLLAGNTYPNLVNKIWNSLEGGSTKYLSTALTEEQTETVKNMLPMALYKASQYFSYDYDKDQQTMGALAYNIEDVMVPMHYQDVNVAWVMSEDSYYDDETVRPLNASKQMETSVRGLNGDNLKGIKVTVKNSAGDVVATIDDGEVKSCIAKSAYAKSTLYNLFINTPAVSDSDKYTITVVADSTNSKSKELRIGNRNMSATKANKGVVDLAGDANDYVDIRIAPGKKYELCTTLNKTTTDTLDVADCSVELDETEYEYDGTAKEPVATVKIGGRALTLGTDYSVSYADNTNAGTATVTITGMGKYEGSKDVDFTIDKATLQVEQSSVKMRVGKTVQINTTGHGDVVYTSGNKAIATVSNTGLVKGVKIGVTKVTVSMEADDNHNAVSKTIDVIVPTVITKAALSASSYTYDNNAHKPSVKTVNGSTKFVKDTDYTVVYKDSSDTICDEPTEVGTYKAIVTGIGNCDGTATLTYKINQAAKTFTGIPASVTAYISKDAPEIIATTNDDTVVSYKINSTKYADISASGGTCTITAKKAGTATLTISAPASKNYKAASKTVKITVKDPVNINSTKVTTVGKAYWNNGEAISPSVTVKSGKTTFKKDTDYKVNYELVNEQGESVSDWEVGNYVRVTVDATDENMLACKGSYTKDVKIEKASQPATATAPATIYYGIGKEAVKIALANIPTTEGDDNPTISYTSSNKKYATVDDEGNITPLKAGKVTITVNIGATKHYAAKTIKLTVNVKSAIELSKSTTQKLISVSALYDDGQEIVPTVSIKGYKQGDDYTVEYTSGVTALNESMTVTIKAVEKSGGLIGEYTKTVIVGKGAQAITINAQPSTVKAKATTDVFTISGVKDEALVSVTAKTYAKVNGLGGGQYSVTGIKKGTATVTIKIAATDLYNAKTYTFKLKVTK